MLTTKKSQQDFNTFATSLGTTARGCPVTIKTSGGWVFWCVAADLMNPRPEIFPVLRKKELLRSPVLEDQLTIAVDRITEFGLDQEGDLYRAELSKGCLDGYYYDPATKPI